jgi:hypothetical protein
MQGHILDTQNIQLMHGKCQFFLIWKIFASCIFHGGMNEQSRCNEVNSRKCTCKYGCGLCCTATARSNRFRLGFATYRVITGKMSINVKFNVREITRVCVCHHVLITAHCPWPFMLAVLFDSLLSGSFLWCCDVFITVSVNSVLCLWNLCSAEHMCCSCALGVQTVRL